ncbi:MAG TPA: selenium-binding protein SBP56-related protein [Gemmatimonadaceae bacterium]|jgi:selenium-binding protein 1|nr:selenium-binding protein SBP56-related protein [Gemmatimonadaceae bacterium]
MTRIFPDRASHATPSGLAVATPSEERAYVVLQSAHVPARPDAVGVIDTDATSTTYGKLTAVMTGQGVPRRPDLAWHRAHDTLLTSEWDTSSIVRDGPSVELLLAGKYGARLQVWDARTRRHVNTIDLGIEQQLVLDLRAAHNPTRAYGFACAFMSLADLSASVFLWYLDRSAGGVSGEWRARRIIGVQAESAEPSALPPLLRRFAMVPPLITRIDLSQDDRFLYVCCWGTGELRQYDVSDPFNPVLTGAARLGGIVTRAPHPATRSPLSGGPQALAVSRDGRRVYVANSLSPAWDARFHHPGGRGWVAKLDVGRAGGLTLDPRFLVELEEGLCPHYLTLKNPLAP